MRTPRQTKRIIREVKSDIIVQEIEKEDEQSLQNDPVTPENVIKIGTIISEFTDDGEYDIPTFVRNQRSI